MKISLGIENHEVYCDASFKEESLHNTFTGETYVVVFFFSFLFCYIPI